MWKWTQTCLYAFSIFKFLWGPSSRTPWDQIEGNGGGEDTGAEGKDIIDRNDNFLFHTLNCFCNGVVRQIPLVGFTLLWARGGSGERKAINLRTTEELHNAITLRRFNAKLPKAPKLH